MIARGAGEITLGILALLCILGLLPAVMRVLEVTLGPRYPRILIGVARKALRRLRPLIMAVVSAFVLQVVRFFLGPSLGIALAPLCLYGGIPESWIGKEFAYIVFFTLNVPVQDRVLFLYDDLMGHPPIFLSFVPSLLLLALVGLYHARRRIKVQWRVRTLMAIIFCVALDCALYHAITRGSASAADVLLWLNVIMPLAWLFWWLDRCKEQPCDNRRRDSASNRCG